MFTTKKLENKTQTSIEFFYQYTAMNFTNRIFLSLYLSVNTDEIFLLVTDKVTEGIILLVILSLIFNL
jgi:hypothetical protein